MASPQIEDGYFRIANELAEALAKHHPPGSSGQVLWAILRKTYGWNKKTDSISITQLMEFCGISRRSVIYALQDLEAKNMIFIERKWSQPNSITFNKNHETWMVQNFAPQTGKNRENARLRKNVLQCKTLHPVQNFAPLGQNIQENQEVQNFARCKTLGKTDEVLHPQKTLIQKTKDKPLPLSIFFDPAVWDEFRKHRIAMKAKMTDLAERKILDKLRKFKDLGYDPEEIINQSIENGWKGVFEPSNNHGPKPTFDQRIR